MTTFRNFDDLRSFLSSSISLSALKEGLEIHEYWTASSIVEWLQKEIQSSTVDDRSYRKRCTKCLNLIVKRYHAFPSSFFCNDVRRDGDHDYPVGGGGFADVYKGIAGSQTVCLKVLRVHTQNDEKKRKKMVENFCQEALIWTQLSHPNVLQLLGVNTTLFGADFCLVSPWMVNSDVITFLKKTPDHDRLRSIREVAAGLEYLHSRSPMIVHGDIRGANILVDEHSNCRLADFGLSMEAPGTMTAMIESSTGGMKGSVRWMAPEMFQASTAKDKDRSPRDIYAYACTIIEIVTGRPPFPDFLDVTVMTEVLLNRARPERPTGVWCPDTVWELVEQCWHQNHLERPTAKYIHNYLTGLTTKRDESASGDQGPSNREPDAPVGSSWAGDSQELEDDLPLLSECLSLLPPSQEHQALRNFQQRRAPSIAELTQQVNSYTLRENKSFKYYLKHAEANRREAFKFAGAGELESAFIYFRRTKNLVLETLPSHPDYRMLDDNQRKNLNMNGLELLNNLNQLESLLSHRYEAYRKDYPEEEEAHQRALRAHKAQQEALDRAAKLSEEVAALELKERVPQSQTHSSRNVDDASRERTTRPNTNTVPTAMGIPAPPAAVMPRRKRHPSFVGPHMMPLVTPTNFDTGTETPFTASTTYPPPITTSTFSSMPPSDNTIHYPQLMSLHQKTQGYVPSDHPLLTTSTGLKTVILPRSSLPRFLAIAGVNTSRNKETCGLVLGREVRGRYVVSTLLIPKQHSTSDTCTMDEEDLVMQFTEERDLITLGWIHTHPTQSCFMSSVDLHTHCAFQLMFPESFAVVCAPKSTPNFGIYRLTDPRGLSLISNCKVKEAFHPHPGQPVYTEVDVGHVQIRDSPLEIVDLRD